jgi:putative PIN family toxin of toxin-antitoxin system
MTERPLVVLDTTVLVSAFLTKEGVAAEVLDRAANDYALILSRDIIAETLAKLLHKPKLRKAYSYTDAAARQYVSELVQSARLIVNDPIKVARVVRDPEDDMVVACAATASASFIVTRDKDLLTLGAFEGAKIVTPRQFLDLLAAT